MKLTHALAALLILTAGIITGHALTLSRQPSPDAITAAYNKGKRNGRDEALNVAIRGLEGAVKRETHFLDSTGRAECDSINY